VWGLPLKLFSGLSSPYPTQKPKTSNDSSVKFASSLMSASRGKEEGKSLAACFWGGGWLCNTSESRGGREGRPGVCIF